MEFVIDFESPRDVSLVSLISTPGIKDLDRARFQNPDTRDIPTSRTDINTGMSGKRVYTITIPEKIARQTGLFDNTRNIVVSMGPNDLDKYTIYRADVETMWTNGEKKIKLIWFTYTKRVDVPISRVSYILDLDAERIIDDWAKDGYPLKWGSTREIG